MKEEKTKFAKKNEIFKRYKSYKRRRNTMVNITKEKATELYQALQQTVLTEGVFMANDFLDGYTEKNQLRLESLQHTTPIAIRDTKGKHVLLERFHKVSETNSKESSPSHIELFQGKDGSERIKQIFDQMQISGEGILRFFFEDGKEGNVSPEVEFALIETKTSYDLFVYYAF